MTGWTVPTLSREYKWALFFFYPLLLCTITLTAATSTGGSSVRCRLGGELIVAGSWILGSGLLTLTSRHTHRGEEIMFFFIFVKTSVSISSVTVFPPLSRQKDQEQIQRLRFRLKTYILLYLFCNCNKYYEVNCSFFYGQQPRIPWAAPTRRNFWWKLFYYFVSKYRSSIVRTSPYTTETDRWRRRYFRLLSSSVPGCLIAALKHENEDQEEQIISDETKESLSIYQWCII